MYTINATLLDTLGSLASTDELYAAIVFRRCGVLHAAVHTATAYRTAMNNCDLLEKLAFMRTDTHKAQWMQKTSQFANLTGYCCRNPRLRLIGSVNSVD